jgi:conjugal transfer pilus assembly protein TraF
MMISAAAQSAHADSLWGDDTFFGRHKEWWFWYRPLPSDEPVPPPVEPVQPAPEQPREPAALQPSSLASQSASPGSSTWLTERLEFFKKKAIDDPTPENVRAFFYAQKAALDRSTRFAEVAQRVVQADPYLDENATHPTANASANLGESIAKAQITSHIQDLAKSTGLLFVFRSDCPYCEQQVPILQVLAKAYHLTVKAISVDGKPLPGNPYPDFAYNPGAVARLGTDVTPSLYLLHPPDGVAPISFGVSALDDLEKRILVAAVSAGWLSEKDYDATKQYHPVANLEEGIAAARQPSAEELNDPQSFVKFMQSQVKK